MFAPFGIVHIFYLLILGSCGWLATLYLTLFPVGTLLFPITYNTDLLCCFALAGCARLLAFRVQRKIPLALDSAFYIAIRYSFGTLTAVLCVAVILSLDAIIRYLYDKNFWIIPGDAPAIHMIAFPIYNGGLPALILLVLGVSFGDYPLEQFPDASLAWHVPVFGALFLVLHYLVSGVTAWLRGFASIKRWQEIWIDVVGAELMLIPLAVAMVLAYRHQGMALFLLIGAIGLLFNWVYRKGVKDRDNLEQRVSE